MIASVVDWILHLHGAAALAIVFAVPALEASAFVGFVFPGEVAVVLGGVLAYQGRVPLLAVIAAAVAGAIAGDTIGYFVGRRWGRRILSTLGRRVPLVGHRIEDHLDRAQSFLGRRGGSAVFLGRFTAALRVMVPGLAGMAEMPYPRFALANAAGGLVWATAHVLLGYLGGAAWRRVAGYASRVGLGLLVLILLGLLASRLLRRVRAGEASVPDRLAALKPAAWLRRRFPRRAAWLARRVDTSSPRGFLLSVVGITGSACAWVLVVITQDVVTREESVRFDPGVLRFFVDHRTASLTVVMRGVTWLGSTAVAIPVAVVVGALLLHRRRDWRQVATLAAGIAGAVVFYDLMKPAVGRPRPPLALHLIGVSGAAFPSGHATLAVAFWGALALVLSSGRSVRTGVLLWSAAGTIALLVGLSRLYLGVHWLTDVLGGYALGGLWLCVLAAFTVVVGPRSGAEAVLKPEAPEPSQQQPAAS